MIPDYVPFRLIFLSVCLAILLLYVLLAWSFVSVALRFLRSFLFTYKRPPSTWFERWAVWSVVVFAGLFYLNVLSLELAVKLFTEADTQPMNISLYVKYYVSPLLLSLCISLVLKMAEVYNSIRERKS